MTRGKHSLGAISERPPLGIEVHLVQPEPRTEPCSGFQRRGEYHSRRGSGGGGVVNHQTQGGRLLGEGGMPCLQTMEKPAHEGNIVFTIVGSQNEAAVEGGGGGGGRRAAIKGGRSRVQISLPIDRMSRIPAHKAGAEGVRRARLPTARSAERGFTLGKPHEG